MKQLWLFFLSLLCSITLLTGCATDRANSLGNVRMVSVTDNGEKLSVTLTPAHLLALHAIAISVHMQSLTATKSTLHTVRIKERMSDMSMPVPTVTLTKGKFGDFVGTLVFVMTGSWTLIVTGTTTAGSFSQQFHVQIQS